MIEIKPREVDIYDIMRLLSNFENQRLPVEMTLAMDMELDSVLPAGTKLMVLPLGKGLVKLFHNTGWWIVPEEYFVGGKTE